MSQLYALVHHSLKMTFAFLNEKLSNDFNATEHVFDFLRNDGFDERFKVSNSETLETGLLAEYKQHAHLKALFLEIVAFLLKTKPHTHFHPNIPIGIPSVWKIVHRP